MFNKFQNYFNEKKWTHDKNIDFIYKIIIKGNIRVGKTSLFNYYTVNNSRKNAIYFFGKMIVIIITKRIIMNIFKFSKFNIFTKNNSLQP